MGEAVADTFVPDRDELERIMYEFSRGVRALARLPAVLISSRCITWSTVWARFDTHGGGDRVTELLWSAGRFGRALPRPRHTLLVG